VPPADNPGVILGTIIGVAARSGRDKVTIVASPGIGGFGAWLEQLLGESTGKQGKGVIAVDGEPLGPPQVYGPDRLFAYLRLADGADGVGGAGGADAKQDAAMAAIETAGHPVVRIDVARRYCIGQEFFRWEIATAVAAAILGINPFDQPDVEASKDKTRELTAAYERTGKLPPQTPLLMERGLALFADAPNRKALGTAGTLVEYLAAHFKRLRAGDYCALLAYVERNALHREALQAIRVLIRNRKRVATCLGFGPRFLHSTGQTYKGGPDTGVFLHITCDDAADLDVRGLGGCRGINTVSAPSRRRRHKATSRSSASAGGASCACISAPTWRRASRPSRTPCGRLSAERITAARKQNAHLPRLLRSTGLIEQNQ
jgi:transaldolase / glucose-6-phosphate isomerase